MDYLIQDPPNMLSEDRILVLADGRGATQVISFELPLRTLRQFGSVEMAMVDEASFINLSPREAEQAVRELFDLHRPTRVIASRFGAIGAHAVVEECTRRNIKLIMHLDDNLFEVPEVLGPAKYLKYNDSARLSRMRLLSERADLIYASTAELKNQLEELGISTPIRAGEIYCALPVPAKKWQLAEGGERTIGYMGTVGHAEDLASVAPAILEVMNRLPDTRFVTFGSIKMPEELKHRYPNRCTAIRSSGSYEEFVQQFRAMNWNCGLAPLANTRFNKCKANTKFVEYSMAGIPVVASSGHVYNKIVGSRNGRLAKSKSEWIDAIMVMIENTTAAKQYVENAQNHLKKQNNMSRLTKQLGEILEISCY